MKYIMNVLAELRTSFHCRLDSIISINRVCLGLVSAFRKLPLQSFEFIPLGLCKDSGDLVYSVTCNTSFMAHQE